MGVPMSTSQDFVNWVCGPELDHRYLKYVLQLERETLLRFASGTTHQTIYFPEVKAFHALLPQKEVQRAIADVLGALDEKVESNRRLIDTALDLATALMCDASGEVVRTGDVVELDKGLSYKGSGLVTSAESGIPMANLANFGTSGWLKLSGLKYYAGDSKPRHVVHGGDLLVANTDLTQQRVILGRPALVPPGMTMLYTHHVYAVRFTSRSELRLPLWAALRTPAFRARAEGFATGTTVAGLPKDALLDFEFAVPGRRAVAEATDLLARAWTADRESVALQDLRDTLLPELLSGRMTAPVAGEFVELAL
jgi:type I restriction enzyme S subunit